MVHTQEGSVLYVCTKFEACSSIRSKVIRGPKISKLGHVTQATPNKGSFYGAHAGGVRPLCMGGAADFKVRGTKQDSRAERAKQIFFCTPLFQMWGTLNILKFAV